MADEAHPALEAKELIERAIAYGPEKARLRVLLEELARLPWGPEKPADAKPKTLSLPAGTKITIGSGGATLTFPGYESS